MSFSENWSYVCFRGVLPRASSLNRERRARKERLKWYRHGASLLHSSLSGVGKYSVVSRGRNLDTNPATTPPPTVNPVCKIAEAVVAKNLLKGPANI